MPFSPGKTEWCQAKQVLVPYDLLPLHGGNFFPPLGFYPSGALSEHTGGRLPRPEPLQWALQGKSL